MACSMKWATSLIPFSQLATREIVVRIRSLAARTFLSRTWGKKDGSVESKCNMMVVFSMKLHSSHYGDNFYAVSLSLILVWPLWVQIPESHPTKVVKCVVLCILCVCVCVCVFVRACMRVLLPPSANPIALNQYIISYILDLIHEHVINLAAATKTDAPADIHT